jgi:hypothetical protein
MSRQNNSQQQQNVTQVYTPGFKSVLMIPTHDVHHVPPPHLNVTRLVLCANYHCHNPASCNMGGRCKFIHADTSAAVEHTIHVNYAWRSMGHVTYDRFAPGAVFHVAAPNGKVTTDVISSQLCLKTRALESSRRPLSHCAHYYFNRTCNLGSDCQFIHAIYVDAAAADFQRAPVPSQLGRQTQRPQQQQQQQQQSPPPQQVAHPVRQTVEADAPSPAVARPVRETVEVDAPSPALSMSTSATEDDRRSAGTTELSADAAIAEHHRPATAGNVEPARALRFRHNPYSNKVSATVCC